MKEKNKIAGSFLSLEERLNLFNLKIIDVYIWDYVRMSIYLKILFKKNNYSISDTSLKSSKVKSVLKLAKLLFRMLKKRHRIPVLDKEIVSIGHPRKVKEENLYIDKYNFDIFNEIQKDYSIVSLDHPFKLSHFKPRKESNIYYLDYLELIAIVSPFTTKLTLKTKEKKEINKIRLELLKAFDIDLNIEIIIIKAIKRYKKLNKKINEYFKGGNIKLLMCLDGYNFTNKIFLEVANKKNIPTIELQHGTIGEYHIGYKYKEKKKAILSFPKYLFVWGEFWKKNLALPLYSNSKVVGFPYLEKRIKDYNTKRKNILIISQWTIGFELLEKINSIAEKISDFNFLFKLHPNEVNTIDEYKNNITTKNITIVDPKADLYDLFNLCQAQIGVYSTALLEGLAFKLETFIIPLEGYQVFNELIALKVMCLVEDENEIISSLKEKNRFDKTNYENIWKNNALENTIKEIKKIIN